MHNDTVPLIICAIWIFFSDEKLINQLCCISKANIDFLMYFSEIKGISYGLKMSNFYIGNRDNEHIVSLIGYVATYTAAIVVPVVNGLLFYYYGRCMKQLSYDMKFKTKMRNTDDDHDMHENSDIDIDKSDQSGIGNDQLHEKSRLSHRVQSIIIGIVSVGTTLIASNDMICNKCCIVFCIVVF